MDCCCLGTTVRSQVRVRWAGWSLVQWYSHPRASREVVDVTIFQEPSKTCPLGGSKDGGGALSRLVSGDVQREGYAPLHSLPSYTSVSRTCKIETEEEEEEEAANGVDSDDDDVGRAGCGTVAAWFLDRTNAWLLVDDDDDDDDGGLGTLAVEYWRRRRTRRRTRWCDTTILFSRCRCLVIIPMNQERKPNRQFFFFHDVDVRSSTSLGVNIFCLVQRFETACTKNDPPITTQ